MQVEENKSIRKIKIVLIVNNLFLFSNLNNIKIENINFFNILIF